MTFEDRLTRIERRLDELDRRTILFAPLGPQPRDEREREREVKRIVRISKKLLEKKSPPAP